MHIVVIGGGIAGYTCAKTLASLESRYIDSLKDSTNVLGQEVPAEDRNDPASAKIRVTLVSLTPVLRAVAHVPPAGRSKLAEEVRVTGAGAAEVERRLGGAVSVRLAGATAISAPPEQAGGVVVTCADGTTIRADRAVVCAGASPKNPFQDVENERLKGLIHTIRDDTTTEHLRKMLSTSTAKPSDADARPRVLVVGNGGIAMELVHELAARGTVGGTGDEAGHGPPPTVLWAVRESHAGNAFLGPRASQFLAPDLAESAEAPFVQQMAAAAKVGADGGTHESAGSSKATVAALNGHENSKRRSERVSMLYNREITGVFCGDEYFWAQSFAGDQSDAAAPKARKHPGSPLEAVFSDGSSVGCDFALFAIGVTPRTALFRESPPAADAPGDARGERLGSVDRQMRVAGFRNRVHAAGDCCEINRDEMRMEGTPCHWRQMRLWTQARTQGSYAAFCSIGLADELFCGHNFDIFAHATRFFGFRAVFLGDFEERAGDDDGSTTVLRCVPGRTYVSFRLRQGRLVGAVLLGDTDLEETAENLIMDGIDVASLGADMLDPENDLGDYFD